jgi:hypothetical protein
MFREAKQKGKSFGGVAYHVGRFLWIVNSMGGSSDVNSWENNLR